MSVKNNVLVSVAALALGFTVSATAKPICDALLNDVLVSDFGVAEIDSTGRVLVLVEVPKVGGGVEYRPVADASGNVKVYADVGAAMTMSKRANIEDGATISFVKMEKTTAVGDPIAALKAKYKRFKSEAATGLKQSDAIAGKVAAAFALGWDVATGTPENTEYLDLANRQGSIAEWKSACDAQVIALAASLTAAGINPATVV